MAGLLIGRARSLGRQIWHGVRSLRKAIADNVPGISEQDLKKRVDGEPEKGIIWYRELQMVTPLTSASAAGAAESTVPTAVPTYRVHRLYHVDHSGEFQLTKPIPWSLPELAAIDPNILLTEIRDAAL